MPLLHAKIHSRRHGQIFFHRVHFIKSVWRKRNKAIAQQEVPGWNPDGRAVSGLAQWVGGGSDPVGEGGGVWPSGSGEVTVQSVDRRTHECYWFCCNCAVYGRYATINKTAKQRA